MVTGVQTCALPISYGVMAAVDGATVQLLELIVFGYLSLGFYILFKGCLNGVLGRYGKH